VNKAEYVGTVCNYFTSSLSVCSHISTRAQLSQRKSTVAFVCYWHADDIHTFCDLGYLKLTVAVCAKRGKIMVQ